ncbi:MAG TPA: hypothetical protein VKA30_03825, partial [Actinomycetota bacterium]|nr:hypothetical protein [Actinomycetota bacterium]
MVLALLELLTGAAALWIGAATAMRPIHLMLVRFGVQAPGERGPILGLSLEALAVSVVASARGQGALAAGTAFGGIQVMLVLAFGVGVLLARRPVRAPSASATILPAILLLATGLAVRDLVVTPFEGLALVVAFALFAILVMTVLGPGSGLPHAPAGFVGGGSWIAAVLGAGVAVAGAMLLLAGADRTVVRTNLDPGFIGAAVTGVLVALPHALALVPSSGGPLPVAPVAPFDAAAGLGAAAVGVAAMVHPLVLDGAASSSLLAAGALYAVAATVLLATGRAGRLTGVLIV